ncbi:MAG: leucine-rich repeat domain-containing protein, partial [Puniceicoccales bacterium]|nr:leucine-rich repeat domain-containing protein [Puniceicoccales bacterium]
MFTNGILGEAYSQTLAATGTAPITWSVAVGSLPAGLTLSSEGVIQGTPSEIGIFTFSVKAANGTLPDATKELTIQIKKDITVDFTDPNFLAQVRAELNIASGPIYNLDPAVTGLTTLHLENRNISSLAGVEHFVALQRLDCYNNQLTTLPELPSGLQRLDCHNNQLTTLPELPSSLEWLYCNNNLLTTLPELPSGLQGLNCDNNLLTTLPELPPNLKEIYCHDNQLTALPELPSGLEWLYCNDNQLTTLPELPPNLKRIYCHDNQLTALPELPSGLLFLNCNNNQLTALPEPPLSLKWLYCRNNQLTKLTAFPMFLPNLLVLCCDNNQLTSLPTLPPNLKELECQNNRLTGFNIPSFNTFNPILTYIDCRYNYMTNTTDVTGFLGTWDSPHSHSYRFSPQNPPGFNAVTNIVNLPTTATIGVPLKLSGTVIPADANKQTITWAIYNDPDNTGASLTGSTFTASAAGTVEISAWIAYGVSSTGEDFNKKFTITVSAPVAPTIITNTLAGGTVGAAYSQTLAATGTVPTWSITDGALPVGLSLSSAGMISGVPTVTGTFTFTVKASNGINPDDTKQLSITVGKAILSGTAAINGTQTYSQTLTAVTSGLTSTPSVALGALSYQWKRGGADISGATNETYTTLAADVGQTLSVTVTAANCSGSVTSAATGTIGKGVNPAAAPALNYTVSDAFPKTITIEPIAGAEYSFDGGVTWNNSNTYTSASTETLNLAIRWAATGIYDASGESSTEINTANSSQPPPERFTLSYAANGTTDYTVTIPASEGAEYSFDGTNWSGENSTNALPETTVAGYKRMSARPGYNASSTVSDSVTLPAFLDNPNDPYDLLGLATKGVKLTAPKTLVVPKGTKLAKGTKAIYEWHFVPRGATVGSVADIVIPKANGKSYTVKAVPKGLGSGTYYVMLRYTPTG